MWVSLNILGRPLNPIVYHWFLLNSHFWAPRVEYIGGLSEDTPSTTNLPCPCTLAAQMGGVLNDMGVPSRHHGCSILRHGDWMIWGCPHDFGNLPKKNQTQIILPLKVLQLKGSRPVNLSHNATGRSRGELQPMERMGIATPNLLMGSRTKKWGHPLKIRSSSPLDFQVCE